MRRDQSRIDDIITFAKAIAKYVPLYRTDETRMTLDAVMYNLIAIGEAARLLTDDYKSAHPDTPWRSIIDLRNNLTHEYFRTEPVLVLQIAERDVPALIKDVTSN